MNINEIKIPVPWGFIAAKGWGDPQNKIVLVFHGLLDNAGSFDRLIPHLSNNFYYVCIDMPGHGQSSHFPPYLPAYSLNFLLSHKLIVDFFKRDKYIFMGHSYGGQLSFLFTQVYPEYVEKLILLDTVHLFPVTKGHYYDYLRSKFDFVIDLYEKLATRTPPTYTYEEAVDKLQNSRNNGHISKEAAAALAPRALKPVEDGRYQFAMDQRLKSFVNPIHDFRYIMDSIKRNPIECPVLIILGRESELQQMYFKELINYFKKRPNFIIKIVDGHHDVHNNTPEMVAPYINKMLSNKKSKL